MEACGGSHVLWAHNKFYAIQNDSLSLGKLGHGGCVTLVSVLYLPTPHYPFASDGLIEPP